LAFEGDAADEREYIGQVARFAGVTSNLVLPVDIRLDRAQQLAARSRNFPGMPSLLMHDPVCEEMRSRSMRIHITGVGGDQWLMGNQLHTADLLRRLRLRSAIAQARFDSKVLTGNFSPLYLFARYGIAPLLPRSVIKIGKRFRTPHSVPTWIEPAFARKTALFDRLNVRRIRQKGTTLAQNGVWATANSAWLGLVLEMVDEHGFSFGLERRHPFLDRRLVEFCIGLPEEQRWRQDELKFVLRTAMKGILPEGIRVRRTKGDFTAVAAKYLLRPDVRATVESSTMANLGWVNRAGISRMYSQMAADYERGADFSRFVIPLSMICGVESWLQHAQFGSLVRRFEPVS
jgi:asparagine synthase (glutamine-hydrolysing)